MPKVPGGVKVTWASDTAEPSFAQRYVAERVFAERHVAERYVCRKIRCRKVRLPKDTLPKDAFAERHVAERGVCRKVFFQQAAINSTCNEYVVTVMDWDSIIEFNKRTQEAVLAHAHIKAEELSEP